MGVDGAVVPGGLRLPLWVVAASGHTDGLGPERPGPARLFEPRGSGEHARRKNHRETCPAHPGAHPPYHRSTQHRRVRLRAARYPRQSLKSCFTAARLTWSTQRGDHLARRGTPARRRGRRRIERRPSAAETQAPRSCFVTWILSNGSRFGAESVLR